MISSAKHVVEALWPYITLESTALLFVGSHSASSDEFQNGYQNVDPSPALHAGCLACLEPEEWLPVFSLHLPPWGLMLFLHGSKVCFFGVRLAAKSLVVCIMCVCAVCVCMQSVLNSYAAYVCIIHT